MNNQNRKDLKEAIEKIKEAGVLLSDAKDIISGVSQKEQEKYDNASQNLKNSERFLSFVENATVIEEAVGYLEDATERATESIEAVEEVIYCEKSA